MEHLIVKRQITYSCIFPNGNDNLNELIKIIPSKSAIKWLTYLLLKKDLQTNNQDEFHFLIPLLFNMNKKLQHVISEYLEFINNEISNYQFIDKTAILILIEYILENHNDIDVEVLESKDDFSNLFIAYLICCDERIKYSSENLMNIKDAESQVLHHLPEQLKINDIIFPKDYRVEFIRFYSFMIFCKEDPEFKEYLNLFLEENKIEKWEDYLIFILDTYLKIVTNKDGASNLIQINPNTYYGKKFLDSMSVDIKNFKRTPDFIGLRSKPVYNYGNNLYSIISSKFFIDKMFQSFLFDFASILKGKSKIKNYPQLKQLVGERFTEKYLFYEIMKGCFSNNYKKLFSGEVLKRTLVDGEPDFYIRKGKNIFLFEFKDVMLSADIKNCGHLERINNEILQKFELSTSNKPKGITQLLNVIENKLSSILNEYDNFEVLDKLNVYPIVIYQDSNFDIEGVRYLLNNRFSLLKKDRVISEDYLIKDFIMLPLETLIKLEDYFNDGTIILNDLIDNYIIETKKSEQNKLLPFNKYVMREAKAKGYNDKMSSRFREIINSLQLKKA